MMDASGGLNSLMVYYIAKNHDIWEGCDNQE